MAAADLDFPFEMLPTRQASERVTFCGRICVFPLAFPWFGQYILFVDVCYATLYRQAGGNSSDVASPRGVCWNFCRVSPSLSQNLVLEQKHI